MSDLVLVFQKRKKKKAPNTEREWGETMRPGLYGNPRLGTQPPVMATARPFQIPFRPNLTAENE